MYFVQLILKKGSGSASDAVLFRKGFRCGVGPAGWLYHIKILWKKKTRFTNLVLKWLVNLQEMINSCLGIENTYPADDVIILCITNQHIVEKSNRFVDNMLCIC